jgi:signal transduction histidine kinase
LTAVVLGTLLLFAVLVLLVHVLAIGHATEPLRLESLRLLADETARDLEVGKRPILPDPFAFAVVTPSGQLFEGTAPRGGFHFHEPQGSPGERCARWGRPCWALRDLVGRRDGARLVVYPRVGGAPGFWGPLSVSFLGTVAAWLTVSALAGLVLLRSLRRADESRRRLLASLAHDLGTPLTSIRGFAETRLATEAGTSSASDRRGWTVVFREALRMQRLIEDMLALTRLEAGRFTIVHRPFDLREVLRAAAERAELAQGTGPVVDVPDGPAVARADRDRIDQALANLVDNAYRHGGGRSVKLTLERRGDAWRITVSDEGPGLTAEARAHLFEPFRTSGSGQGSGLGLGIAREIVSRHGGTLRLEDGPGCRVVFELPAGGPAEGA